MIHFGNILSRCFSLVAFSLLLFTSCHKYILNRRDPVMNESGKRILPAKDEEGIHSFKVIEWWYHYGFLNVSGADSNLTHRYDSIGDFSFISSFIISPGGRSLMYKITDLRTGKNYHYLVFDKMLKTLSFPIKDKKDVFTFSKSSNEKQ